MDITDPKVIAAIAGVIGALLGFLGKAVSSRQKINEINSAYSNKLHERYLESAKDYTKSVYVPISISLSNLNHAFLIFRADNSEVNLKGLKDSIDLFIEKILELSSKGAGAFLTTELDERLQSFFSFVRESKDADESTIKLVFEFKLPYLGSRYKDRIEHRAKGKLARGLWSPRLSFSLGIVGASFEATEILSAPLGSRDFEERFVRDSHIINVLIKEVTLGANARIGHNVPVNR